MSSKLKTNESTGAEVSQAEAGWVPVNSARNEEIRFRAHEIYLERSGQPGGELDDWLQAERELGNGGV